MTTTAPHPVESVAVTVSDRVTRLLDAAWADNTRRAYAADLRHFAAWCETTDRVALPADPQTVAEYLAAHTERLALSTLRRRMAAISTLHRTAGYPSPTDSALARQTWRGLRRHVANVPGRARPATKQPLLPEDLRRIVAELPDRLLGTRDAALLLLGFAGALRRSELARLELADLQPRPEGLAVTIRRSKTDQEGTGWLVGIPYGTHTATCPVRATRRWIQAAGLTDGPLFRSVDRHEHVGGAISDRAVALVVQRSVGLIGRDPTQYGGHSLRAGLATAAAAAGKTERAIANQTGHRSLTVLRGYIRDGSLFRDNAAADVGL